MSKVICDICGTSYPETASQCPICGCVRSADSPLVEENNTESNGYTYVKGGRFSKSNVRKRNKTANTIPEGEKKPANKKALGLIIVLVCLILIVGFMIIYILSGLSNRPGNSQNPNETTTETVTVPCTGLSLSQLEITLADEGEVWLLEATPSPADATDQIVFTSSNEEVATVSTAGKITCTGEGHAIITVSCGDQTAECKVNCVFAVETEPPTVAPEGIRLNRKSITADYEGFSWILYSGTVAVEDINWSSDDPSIATVENGVVTAIAEGTTNIHAEYNGVISSCEIICKFEEETLPEEGEGNGESSGNSDENIEADDGKYLLYSQYGDAISFDSYKNAYDVTIPVGDTVGLYLKNSAGDTLTLTWTITEGDSCSVDENYVTVESSSTNCMLMAEHDGVTYYCYIRTIN